MDVANQSYRGKKAIMDGLLIWDTTGSEKRRYEGTEKKHPETAKLNKSC